MPMMTTMMSMGISMGMAGQRRLLMAGLITDLKRSRRKAVIRPTMKLPQCNSVIREKASERGKGRDNFGRYALYPPSQKEGEEER